MTGLIASVACEHHQEVQMQLTIWAVPLPPKNQGLVHRNTALTLWAACSMVAMVTSSAMLEKVQIRGVGLWRTICCRGGTQHAANDMAIAWMSIACVCIHKHMNEQQTICRML